MNSIASKRDPMEYDVAYHKSRWIYAQRSAFPNSEKVEPESIEKDIADIGIDHIIWKN